MSPAVPRACWLCDGALGRHDGVNLESLGGVAVHERCLPDLGVDPIPPTVPAEDELGPSGLSPS